jgi:excisionase family DNA binding protein
MAPNQSEDKDVKDEKQSNVGRRNVHCEPLLDIDEAAERLSLSSHTVRAMVRQRKIAFVKLGARVLFRPQNLDDYILSHLVQPQAGDRGTAS